MIAGILENHADIMNDVCTFFVGDPLHNSNFSDVTYSFGALDGNTVKLG